jgi:hypothetical protein
MTNTTATYAIIASDRYGYGHEPRRYDVTAEDQVAAAEEGRYRYGKDTGLDSVDIDVENAGIVPTVSDEGLDYS